MIHRDFYATREDGVRLFKTYSDNNKYICKVNTGEIYSEAIDVENAPYEYEETEREIDNYEEFLEESNEDVV